VQVAANRAQFYKNQADGILDCNATRRREIIARRVAPRSQGISVRVSLAVATIDFMNRELVFSEGVIGLLRVCSDGVLASD
jgi:hypothetical protein